MQYAHTLGVREKAGMDSFQADCHGNLMIDKELVILLPRKQVSTAQRITSTIYS